MASKGRRQRKKNVRLQDEPNISHQRLTNPEGKKDNWIEHAHAQQLVLFDFWFMIFFSKLGYLHITLLFVDRWVLYFGCSCFLNVFS